MSQRETQKKETELRIHQAISELIKMKSYESITIREISARAKISVGTYYNYYKSKDEIIFKAMERSALVTIEEIQPLLNKSTGIENLRVYLALQLDLFENMSIPWLKEVFRSYLYHLSDVILDRNSANYQVILPIIKQGQRDGTIRSYPEAKSLAWIVLKMIIANFFCYGMEEGRFDLKQVLMDEILALCTSQE